MSDETPGPDADRESAALADEGAATPSDTRAAFVQYTGRGYTPIRHSFVQKYSGEERASTLAELCRNRKRRALILYLLLLTRWRSDSPPLRSEVWLRALTVKQGNLTWSEASLSTTWTTLVDLRLATKTRVRRMAHVTPRREDRAKDYVVPDGKTKANRYFVLPGEFWTEDWFDRLSLPAICVLLVLLKETNDADSEIHLTLKNFEQWYGISQSSARKGLGELEDRGLLKIRRQRVKAAFEYTGYTDRLHYRLEGPFSTSSRRASRRQAAKAATRRSTAKSVRAAKDTKAARPVRKTRKKSKSET